jgi:hypothetical protein
LPLEGLAFVAGGCIGEGAGRLFPFIPQEIKNYFSHAVLPLEIFDRNNPAFPF